MLFNNFEKYFKEKKGVFHIGANDGMERDWYKLHEFPRVLWFEPNRSIFERLCINLLEYPNNTAYCLGVHDTLKTATLHIASNKGLSSSILEFGTHKRYRPDIKFIRHEVINLVRMDDFIRDNNLNMDDFNFLNIDVQGVELNVIKSFGDLIAKFAYIYTEINEEELYKEGCLVREIDKYLGLYGFKRAMTHMTPYKWGDALYVKKDLVQ